MMIPILLRSWACLETLQKRGIHLPIIECLSRKSPETCRKETTQTALCSQLSSPEHLAEAPHSPTQEDFFPMAEIRSQIGPNSLWQRPTPRQEQGFLCPSLQHYLRHFTREIKLLSTICSNPENKRSNSPESNEIRYVTFYTIEIRAYSYSPASQKRDSCRFQKALDLA